jgi:hypothetical protein
MNESRLSAQSKKKNSSMGGLTANAHASVLQQYVHHNGFFFFK